MKTFRFGLFFSQSFRCASALLLVLTVSHHVSAEVVGENIVYGHDGATLQAYVASNTAVEGPRPGVLVCHAWWGQGEYSRNRARMLAELGYTAVVLDMYGQGVYTADPAEAGQLAGAFYQDRDLFRARAAAGLKVLKGQPDVDPDKLAAIGYCFGGTNVLELAYSGADLAGVVSFHGSLLPPREGSDDAENIKGKVLIAHGQADPFYGNDQLLEVINALQAAGVDTTTLIYSGAVHAFTDPTATGELEGAKYDRAADLRSWEHMKTFFDELFAD
ncbi:MAG: dienelactone hydrolase family protein [Planctomycetota bacterium]